MNILNYFVAYQINYHKNWQVKLFHLYSDSLAFATEPVLASLANLLGNYDKLPLNIQQEIKVIIFEYTNKLLNTNVVESIIIL